jgi:hypothetical protein
VALLCWDLLSSPSNVEFIFELFDSFDKLIDMLVESTEILVSGSAVVAGVIFGKST